MKVVVAGAGAIGSLRVPRSLQRGVESRPMRGAMVVTGQIVGGAVAIAVIGGLIGLLIVELATSKGAVTGLGWGMVIAGAIAGFGAGQSGSPSENLVRGRFLGPNYWGQSAALPQSPLQIALGGFLTFVAGVASLI